jgi:aryl-alcohol dehydrogenase-like predicted oxidoreductase
VAESAHCLHPKFLKVQLEESLERLNLECLDVLYLQNPYEAQGPFNTDNVFFDRMTEAFEFLEAMVEAGKIKNYGIATYSSLRVKPTDLKTHLNLQKVYRLAQKVVGEDKSHHFNYVQVPVNVMMPEAFVEPFQRVENEKGVTENKILVAACSDLELNLVASQPLM